MPRNDEIRLSIICFFSKFTAGNESEIKIFYPEIQAYSSENQKFKTCYIILFKRISPDEITKT